MCMGHDPPSPGIESNVIRQALGSGLGFCVLTDGRNSIRFIVTSSAAH